MTTWSKIKIHIAVVMIFVLGILFGYWFSTIDTKIADCEVYQIDRISCTINDYEDITFPISTADDILIIQSSSKIIILDHTETP